MKKIKEIFLDCCKIIFVFGIPILIVLYFMYDESRYVCKNNSYQHLYGNCSTIQDTTKVKKCREFWGFFRCCFKDCPICIEQQNLNNTISQQRKIEENKIMEQQEMINWTQELKQDITFQIQAYQNDISEFQILLQQLNTENVIEIQDKFDSIKGRVEDSIKYEIEKEYEEQIEKLMEEKSNDESYYDEVGGYSRYF